jgi:hypothetical protein
MANDSMNVHLLMFWAKNPDLKTSEEQRKNFEERFKFLDYKEQYSIMTYMFSKWTEIEHQYWIMSLANQMMKRKNASYRNSEFKSNDTMVDHFIKNFSDSELFDLRTSIWSLMK